MKSLQSDRLTSRPVLFSSLVVLFFIWGFITLLNDLLVPILKQSFSLNYTQALLVQFSFFLTYFVMSLPMAYLLDRWQYKKSIIVGLIIIAVGCCCFIPANFIHVYWVFLIGLFILATGVVMLQVSANASVALLGSSAKASSRLTLAQAVNSFGYVMGPIAVAGVITEQNLPWIYLLIAVVMLLVAFVLISRCDFTVLDLNESACVADSQVSGSIWDHKRFILAFIAIFMYVGAEVTVGSLIVNYLSLPQIVHFNFMRAGKYLSFYWGGAMLGRFIGSYLVAKIRASRVLLVYAIVNFYLLICVIFLKGHAAMWSLLSMGFFNSIMFPVIYSMGLLALPSVHLKHQGSGWLIMAIVGGAVIPLMQGFIADHIGLQHSFFLLLFSYAFIAFFALYYMRVKVRS